MTAAELVRVAQVSANYEAMAGSVRRDGFLKQVSGKPLTARILARYADIAVRAARAEETDPEPRQT